MPTNEKLEVAVADVERHELYWQALSTRVGSVEQRVAAMEALLGNVQVTLQSIQAILAADRQSVFNKAFSEVGTRVP
jgi:hypothetical protein